MNRSFTRLTLAVAATALLSWNAQAQIETPQPSPLSTVTQKIGLTDVTVTYSRPSMKGRKIMGEVVPMGKPWRTGANQATKISFKDELTIEGNKVPAGEYALYTIPAQDNWTIVLNKDTKLGGTMTDYKADQDVARFTVKPMSNCMDVETFTISFMDVKMNSANLTLMWERTMVKVNIMSDYDTKIMSQIDERVVKGTDVKPTTYYTAARYYFENNKDNNKALEWIKKANAAEPQFWTLHTQAKIEGALNKYNDAVASATKSMEMAQKAGNEEYVKMNQELINEYKPKATPAKTAAPAPKKKK